MFRLLQNELLKIYARKSSWIYTILTILSSFLGAWIYNLINPQLKNNWVFMNDFVVGGGALITLFSVMVCGSNVSSEFSMGTIKQLLIRPHRRWQILLSKYIASLSFIAVLIVLFAGSLYAAGVSFFGIGEFNEKVAVSSGLEQSVGELFFLKLLYFLPGLLVIATISFMLSTLFKSQSLAVGVSIFALFFTSILGGVIGLIADQFTWAKYVLFPHLDLTIYAANDKMFETVTLSTSLIILTLHYAVFLIVLFWNFEKKDIYV